MSIAEILRRLRRLVDMPMEKRPIAVTTLERVAGVSSSTTYTVLRDDYMTEKMRIKYERALTLLENDQIQRKPPEPQKHKTPIPKKGELYIAPPKPQQVNVTRVSFKSGAPKLERLAINPKAFPDLPEN